MGKFNYFGMIEDRYSYNVTLKRPTVIRLDGKGITKDLKTNMLDENPGGFAYAMINTAKELSKRYEALVAVSTDEINLVFYDTEVLYNKFGSTKVQKISSLISQEVYSIFNNYYRKGKPVFFDARTFNILDEKIKSYIKYRKSCTYVVCNTYVAKRVMPKKRRHGVPLEKVRNILKKEYSHIEIDYEYFTEGFIFFKGIKMDRSKIMECDIFNFSTVYACRDDKQVLFRNLNNGKISDRNNNEFMDKYIDWDI